ncbi:Pterin-4-alpha-carbinolamine dehydratase 2 [Hypsizygus marmoreus]|uniref:4a-hydroxytetrahydrobiopterin dehydratase n=1 Tax=Hypsizygus marmoreus TaxID=39966 RepID=A0A369JAY7_HYPMA|nr:Pterin-4-alpha-carbinolamine dehydratase 2 [Hypsizygus marmoreus]
MSTCAVRYLALAHRASAHRGLLSSALSARRNGGCSCSKYPTLTSGAQPFRRQASNSSPSNGKDPGAQDSSPQPVVVKESNQETTKSPPTPPSESPASSSLETSQSLGRKDGFDPLPSPPDYASGKTPDGITLLPINLPDPVSGWPTPWFHKFDVDKYLVPLYSRGWGIQYQRDYKNGVIPEFTAELVVRYEFKNFADAMRFINEVVAIAESENHHPTFLSITNQERPEVMVVTQTDSAARPMYYQVEARDMPGVTRRDLRLAYFIETLYEKYTTGSPRRIMKPHERPHWPKLLSTYRAHVAPARLKVDPKTKCNACGGHHVVQQCPMGALERRELRAPLCKRCGRRHQSNRCPQKLVAGTPPPRPCPNCQGNHWLVDCREPQMSRETAEELMLPIPET